MSSIEELVAQQIPRLRRYARALMAGDRSRADDLVQDCLERALSRLHRWRRGSDIRAWLFTIMHNVYVNQVRHSMSGPDFVSLDTFESDTAAAVCAEGALLLDELHLAIGELPPDQRETLLLVAMEGMGYEQVARILDIPVGTVMSRLSRARQRLRTLLSLEQGSRLRRIK